MSNRFRAQFDKAGDKATIWIYEAIGDMGWGDGLSAKRFKDDLNDLGEVDQIDLRINSPGGMVFDGATIYNMLKAHPANVTTYIDGLAASIASVIAMAGDEIIMRENAMMMIHDPWSFVGGNSRELRKEADLLDKIATTIVAAYRNKSNLNDDEITTMMADETWLTADEAMAWGFASSIDEPLQAAASIDLTQFKNAPLTALAVPGRPSAVPDTQQEAIMPTEEKVSAPDTDKILNEYKAKETARRSAIRAMHTPFPDHRELLDAALDDADVTVEQAQASLLNAVGKGAAPIGGSVEIVEDSRDKFITGAAQAICGRIGVEKRDASNEFTGMTMVDIARASLKRNSISTTGKSADAVARQVFNVHSTSDFPLLLSNVANKRLQASYEAYPHRWREIAAATSVSDFKSNDIVKLSSFGNLDVIPEGGEYKYGNVSEGKETIQAQTKGKAISFTRQMLVNDDLGGFDRRAGFMGRSAARTLAYDVFTTLTSNPNMNDGTALFHADHSNLAGSGAAPSVSTLSAAKAAMRMQQDIGSIDYLNIMPSILLVPVALESEALALVTAETDPSKSNSKTVNVHRNTLEVISDPFLDADSATAWYLLADPNDLAAIEVAFLDGVQNPFTDEMVDWDTDSMHFKVRMDYGVAAVEERAAYKNPGA